MITKKSSKKKSVFNFVKPFWEFDKISDLPIAGVRSKTLTYHHQTDQSDLFERPPEIMGFRGIEGRVFEIIAQGEYGGTLRNQRTLCENSGNGNSLNCYPDLADFEECWAREIKGVVIKNYLKLNDGQVAKYVMLLIGEYFKKSPNIKFKPYRHCVEGVTKRFHGRDASELITELAAGIVYSIDIPFSVIYHMHGLGNKSEFTSRSESDNWQDHYTAFSTRGLDAMIRNPQEVLKILGMDPKRYEIERKRSNPRSNINGKNIKSFPQLVITDKNPELLLEQISQEGISQHLEALVSFSEKNRENRVDIDKLKIPQHYIDEYYEGIVNTPF